MTPGAPTTASAQRRQLGKVLGFVVRGKEPGFSLCFVTAEPYGQEDCGPCTTTGLNLLSAKPPWGWGERGSRGPPRIPSRRGCCSPGEVWARGDVPELPPNALPVSGHPHSRIPGLGAVPDLPPWDFNSVPSPPWSPHKL